MIEVTEADRDTASAIGVCPIIYTPHEVRSGMRDHIPLVQAFATHRIEAAKAERDRLRELPEQISVLISDRAILLLDISETDGRLSRLCDEIRQALADALESQP